MSDIKTNYVDYPDKIEFCKNVVVDGTTGANNRDPIPIDETNNGFVPFGKKPSRQSHNQLFYEHGNWTAYQKDTAESLLNSFSTFNIHNKNGVNIVPGFIVTDGATSLTLQSSFNLKNSVIMYNPNAGGPNNGRTDVKFFNFDDVVSKDLTQSWNNGTGLTATTITGNTWNYLFAVGNDAGDVDYALDDNKDGTNVIANVLGIVPEGDYKYMRLIAAIPVYNDGSNKFPVLEYGTDDYIYYKESISTNGNGYSGTPGTPGTSSNLLLSSTTGVTLEAYPVTVYGQLKMKLSCPSGSVSDARVSFNGNGISHGSGTVDLKIGESFVYDVYTGFAAINVKINVEATTGASTTADVDVLAYKNPAVTNEFNI